MSNFKVVECEWKVNDHEIYVVTRAYREEESGFAAMYAGDHGLVDLCLFDDDGNAAWWNNLGDAQMACRQHRLRMDAGDSAAEAAEYVALNGLPDDSDEPAGRDPELTDREVGL